MASSVTLGMYSFSLTCSLLEIVFIKLTFFCSSESHQRQLLLFADNSRKYLDEFSHEFEKCFLNLLKRQFGTKRVHANVVYQEYIRY